MEPFLKGHLEQANEEGRDREAVTLFSELGGFYRGSGRFSESEQAFLNALRLMERAGRTESMEYAVLLINLAGTRRFLRQFGEALSLYEEAEAILKGFNSEEGLAYRLASLKNNQSLVWQDMGKPDKASVCLKEALKLIRSLQNCREEEAITCTNLALLEGKQGNLEAESGYLDEALRLFSSMDVTNNPHYAAALSAMGMNRYHRGLYEEAVRAYEQALELLVRLFGRNREAEILEHNLDMAKKALEESR